MKATVRIKNAAGDVIAVVDSKCIYDVSEHSVQLYIPRDELTAVSMRGLTELARSGGTNQFKPFWDDKLAYVSVREGHYEIEWED